MTLKEFYIYCRGQRLVEENPLKRQALQNLYSYMLEVGITTRGIARHFAYRVVEAKNDAALVAAYQWLRDVLNGAAEVVEIQEMALLAEVMR